MLKLKDKIREQAKVLFNERGYSSVSLRSIAESAGTTIGNLTYHYPQKEALLFAIQRDLQSFVKLDIGNTPGAPEDALAGLYVLFERSRQGLQENEFYFRNMIDLCVNCTAIRKNVMDYRENLYYFYLDCFDRLRNTGHMRLDIPIKHYSTLAYALITIHSLWIQNASPHYDRNLPHQSLADAGCELVHPYLTPKGIERLQVLYGQP